MKEINTEQKKKLKEIQDRLFWGMDNGYVFKYPDALFDRLRPYNFGGLPLSIKIFTNELCNGKCYDCAKYMQLAFKHAKVIWADIESLRVTASNPKEAEHAFIETTDFGMNKTWIVDTSTGLIYDKDFYFELEKPKVNRIFRKSVIMKDPEVMSAIVNNFDEYKYILPATLPLIEEAIKRSNHIGTTLYREKVLSEIEKFKQSINYDEIQAEIEADLRLFKTNPAELDKKFKIVRDERNNIISRNGKPNPYYVSPEEWDSCLQEYAFDKLDEKGLEEFYKKHHEEFSKQLRLEYKKLSRQARIALEKIFENPTQNFYEK